MKSILVSTLAWLGLLMAAWANADAPELPVPMTSALPALLLDLGSEPMAFSGASNIKPVSGELASKAAGSTEQVEKQEVISQHPGFGNWGVDFRFNLPAAAQAGPYRFWARWRQGGEPSVCVQGFEVWAGPDAGHLEKRAAFSLMSQGWRPAWIAADSWLELTANDSVIEIRNSGAGHDAKAFDAFLLAHPLSTLPVSINSEQPAVLLELGQTPAWAAMKNSPGLQISVGSIQAGPAAESVAMQSDEVQVFHQGFGNWGADFRFPLQPAMTPGRYRFFARYKSGGEVSQVAQHFAIKAGTEPEQLAQRAEAATTNTTPWEYQWLEAAGTVTLLPGDRWLEISNSGRADGAKVFDAFLLKLQSPEAAWMSAEQAQSRNRFLALTRPVTQAKRRLYVLDGEGAGDQALFSGLSNAEAKNHYANMAVSYLMGEQAQALAKRLNIVDLPAALISDDRYSVLGVLTRPSQQSEVSHFLADPEKYGRMPAPPAIQADEPTPLREGVPMAWLIGGLQDGLAGASIAGLDTETVMRPNPEQPYLSQRMMGGEMKAWRIAPTQADGSVEVFKSASHGYGWSRGSAYAQLYLKVEQPVQAWLHVTQSGIQTAAWLDSQSIDVIADPVPPAGFAASGETVKTLLKGLTTEGLLAEAWAERPAAPQRVRLDLTPGWHSLLVKLVMQHDEGQRFFFKALFTGDKGQAIDGMQTRLSDPAANLSLNAVAAQLRPLIFVDAPANLPHPGDAIRLKVDMRWQPILEQQSLPAPLLRFPAKLRLRLLDYQGKQIAVRELGGQFPGQAEFDFGIIEEPGYYAVYPSLYTPDGRLIMHYPADGFSVVPGNASQRQRLAQKKVWNNDYYALADGDRSFRQAGDYFIWLQRMGIFNSYGGYPGFDAQYRTQWEQAKQLGLQLFADSSGDSHWLNDNADAGRAFIQSAAGFTRFFKSSNEIDIRHDTEWQKLRDPAHWVERAKREYQQAHKERPDAHYVGGSLVRPGEGDWFKQVLQLGLDQYQDAWDVHAYPQNAPRFDRPLGNGGMEDERGVLAAYAGLGRKNTLPFWLGEAGAKAMHGVTGRRWQAEQVAKMIAWVNSRGDYLGLAFCIAHEYDQAYGRIWDYSMGHKPGEAALYTASALIDGLPYQAVDMRDAAIQAAQFGPTLMIWRDDASVAERTLTLDPAKAWVMVDVVGRRQDLPVDHAGQTRLAISASPVYVLTRDDYQRLTRN